MFKFYNRFCCGLYHLQNKVNPDAPIIMTYLAVMFLSVLFINGIEGLLYLIFKTPYYFKNSVTRYSILFFWALLNYLFIFRKNKFLKYYDQRLPSIFVVLLIMIIFGGGLWIILLNGPRNLPK